MMEFKYKTYTPMQKIMMGLITLVVTIMPICFWVWITWYLVHN